VENTFSGIFGHLKHRFIDFTKVEFCDIQNAGYEFSEFYDHFKYRLIDFTVAFYQVQKADYEFSRPFAYVKRHFHEFVQVALLDAQDAEN
jgi:hypothetical protein